MHQRAWRWRCDVRIGGAGVMRVVCLYTNIAVYRIKAKKNGRWWLVPAEIEGMNTGGCCLDSRGQPLVVLEVPDTVFG